MENYFNLLKDYFIIKGSGLFDAKFYFYTYSDVQQKKINPLWHYLRHGWREGRNPSLFFDTEYYLANNEDVEIAGINPLSHWLLIGRYQQRNPSPYYQNPALMGKQNSDSTWLEIISRYFKCIFPNKNNNLTPEPRDFSFQEDKDFIDRYYQKIHGRPINYEHPRTFTEKMQIYKLYYRKPILHTLSDKYLVRNFIAEKLGEEYLVPVIAVCDEIGSISPSKLPDQFIIKANHGSGWNIICRDKKEFDWEYAKFRLKHWLNTNYYWKYREWCYKNIPPKIMIEELLLDDRGEIPTDYKIHCFDGCPKIIEIHVDRFSSHKILYLDLDWEILPFHKTFQGNPNIPPRPENIPQIIEFAKILSRDLPFVRVDFYLIDNRPYIGEMTFHPGSGFSKFHPQEWDEIVGSWFDISSFSLKSK